MPSDPIKIIYFFHTLTSHYISRKITYKYEALTLLEKMFLICDTHKNFNIISTIKQIEQTGTSCVLFMAIHTHSEYMKLLAHIWGTHMLISLNEMCVTSSTSSSCSSHLVVWSVQLASLLHHVLIAKTCLNQLSFTPDFNISVRSLSYVITFTVRNHNLV